jgi:D-sedoheptulose 7-phosphate isomerase
MSVQSAAAPEFARRATPGTRLAEDAERIARACHDMSLRFHRGGKLLVFGNGGASTDSQHISVEFVHPVLVGKRALPALSLTNDVATVTEVIRDRGFVEVFAHQIGQLATSDDIALGISYDGKCENVLRGLERGRELGLLTVALAGGEGGRIATSSAVDHAFVAPSDDPLVVKELHVTIYHILWELVHVFFEHPGLLDQGTAQ